jgi:hypothetical protein
MNTNTGFYFDSLYPFQDRILKIIRAVDTEFYLTGGTAASRGYLNHRFSDDLDFFVNDDPRFTLWTERIIQVLGNADCGQITVNQKEERFVRLSLTQADVTMKLEMINDVPARTGTITDHPVLGRLDSAENILSNKVTALFDREEPKDLADIWGFCCKMDLSIEEAITNAQSKAAGVFPADLARILCSVSHADWQSVRWIDAPPEETYIAQLLKLGENLLLINK